MRRYLHYKLILIIVFLFGLQDMQAQHNWDGDYPLGDFTWNFNWAGDVVPVTWNSTTDLLFNTKNKWWLLPYLYCEGNKRFRKRPSPNAKTCCFVQNNGHGWNGGCKYHIS